MRVDARILGLVCLTGVALIIAGLIVGKPSVGIEGAYFNRSIGAPAYSGVFASTAPGLLDPSDGNLWIGAGIAVVLFAAIALPLGRRQPQRPQSPLSG